MTRTNRLAGVLVSLLLFLLSATGCARNINADSVIPSGIELKTIVIGGAERRYYLHLPPAYKSSARLPLVLVLHGGGKGDGLAPEKYLGFTHLADQEGFVVVYPNGVDAHWNDGRGVTYRGASDIGVDDVRFISKLIDHLVEAYKVDSKRVYLTGISNGGMMTLRLGCEISSKIAAIAPVVASIPKNIIGTCKPDAPLPVLLINGTDDPLVPYNGGYVHFFRKEMGEVVSTEETVSFWVRRNRCNTTPDVKDMPDRDPGDHSKVTVTTYTNPGNECEVVLYTINGGGHTLPGSGMPDRPWILGRKNNDFNGAMVIWDFFKRHSRTGVEEKLPIDQDTTGNNREDYSRTFR